MLSSFAYSAPLRFSRHCYPRSAPTFRERAPGSEEIRPEPSPFAYSAPQLSAACFREVDGSGRRRVAADIKGNGYRGARGKGCSVRTAGVCLSAGCSVAPRELAGRTPFPDRDRRSPPWSRRPPSAGHGVCKIGPSRLRLQEISPAVSGTTPFRSPLSLSPLTAGKTAPSCSPRWRTALIAGKTVLSCPPRWGCAGRAICSCGGKSVFL